MYYYSRLTNHIGWLDPKVGGHLELFWLCHNYSTIIIILSIIIIIFLPSVGVPEGGKN